MILEAIQAILMGMSVGFEAFLRVLPFYEQLSSLKEQFISMVTGVPFWIVSGLSIIATIITFIFKKLLKTKME